MFEYFKPIPGDIVHKTRLIAYLFLIVTFVGVSIANSGELQKNGFSISLPDGWIEIPRDVLDAKEIECAKLAPNVPASERHYDYGFQLGSSKNWLEYPYILLQIKNTGRISEKKLERGYSLQKDVKDIDKNISSILNNIELGKIVYDKQTKMLWSRMEMNVSDKGPVSGISGGVPTEKGVIFVFGYSLKKDYLTYESVFRSVAVSIIPEPGLAYASKYSDNLPPTVSGINRGKIAAGIATGIIGAVIFSIIESLKKRKKTNRK